MQRNLRVRDESTRDPLLAWPARTELRATLPLAAGFAVLFYSVFLATNFVATLHTRHLDARTAWDDLVPFVPWTVVIYLSINPLLMLSVFILRSREALLPLVLTAAAAVIAAAPFHLMWPVPAPGMGHMADGVLGGLLHFADTVNLTYNGLPSLHVAFALIAAAAYSRRCGRMGRFLFWSWAGLIVLSTLTVRAHYLIDIAGGAALARVVWVVVFRRVSPTEHTARAAGVAT